MSTNGTCESMSAIEQLSAQQRCAADSAAQRNHHCISNSVRSAVCVFSQQSQTGVVFD
jgi:hypothetical protein